MYRLSAENNSVNTKTQLNYNFNPKQFHKEAHEVNAHLQKATSVLLKYSVEDKRLSIVPNSVRGNKAYSIQRKPIYEAIQEALTDNLQSTGTTTNTFFVTLTYRQQTTKPDKKHIQTLRKQLLRHGFIRSIIVHEAHLSGCIHHHMAIQSNSQYYYFKDKKGKYRCNEVRQLVNSTWEHGHTDVQGVVQAEKVSQYIMKELIKQANCEQSIRKWKEGTKLEAWEKKQILTLHYGITNKRRLYSLSAELSQQVKALLVEREQDAEAALFKERNKWDNGEAESITLIVSRATYFSIIGRKQSIFSGRIPETSNDCQHRNKSAGFHRSKYAGSGLKKKGSAPVMVFVKNYHYE